MDAFCDGASPDECLDLAGNVWKFVDEIQDDGLCLLRGGSFRNNRDEAISMLRLSDISPDQPEGDFGFRCALVADRQQTPTRSARK